jgi:hypothetical protein
VKGVPGLQSISIHAAHRRSEVHDIPCWPRPVWFAMMKEVEMGVSIQWEKEKFRESKSEVLGGRLLLYDIGQDI